MPKSIIISNGGVSSLGNANRSNLGNPRKNLSKFKAKYKLLIILLAVLIVAVTVWKYAEYRMRPIIASMAEAHAKSIGAKVVSEAISEEIEANDISYDDLISFEKDENGRIAALKTDIIMINRLKSNLSVVILDKLSNIDDINLYIPVGNLINGEFLSGRGPKIEVILIPVGSVTTNITNVFTSAGINQTRHQIMLDAYVTVSIIMPFAVESVDVMMSVAIAETIIVGEVPNVYMASGD
jgi:sporulation protein YunB